MLSGMYRNGHLCSRFPPSPQALWQVGKTVASVLIGQTSDGLRPPAAWDPLDGQQKAFLEYLGSVPAHLNAAGASRRNSRTGSYNTGLEPLLFWVEGILPHDVAPLQACLVQHVAAALGAAAAKVRESQEQQGQGWPPEVNRLLQLYQEQVLPMLFRPELLNILPLVREELKECMRRAVGQLLEDLESDVRNCRVDLQVRCDGTLDAGMMMYTMNP
jgi:hypothetical protein